MTDEYPGRRKHPLQPGDKVPGFVLPDNTGEPATPFADEMAGKPAVLILPCEGPGAGDALASELIAFREVAADLAALEAAVFIITRHSISDNIKLSYDFSFPHHVLSDPEGTVFRDFGLEPAPKDGAIITVVMDPNQRVVTILGVGEDGALDRRHAACVLEILRSITPPHPPVRLSAQAPVLVLPRVLSVADCSLMIDIWHRPAPVYQTDGLACEGYATEFGDFMVNNESYGRVLQKVVRDPSVTGLLDTKLIPRVLPEIRKAFQTRVSRREDYRIACYDAAEGGVLPAHRDNPVPETRHRRFTMAAVLNGGDFEGGALRFREYGNHEYLPQTGSAIVWSCALLHEVTPVTAGRRFIVGTHLFGA